MKSIHPIVRCWPRLPGALASVLLLAGVALSGEDVEVPVSAWATSRVSSAMCNGSKLHLVATGEVAVAYERAYVVLMHTNILMDVASAYLREQPSGAKPKLAITPLDSNGHYTVNWKKEQSDVRDVWRKTDTNSFFEGGFIITGVRFFGAFETVMNVHVQRLGNGLTGFRADVLIYPHNGLIRFIFSNLLSVESYFRDTMDEMSVDIERVCTDLCLSNQAPAAATAPDTHR